MAEQTRHLNSLRKPSPQDALPNFQALFPDSLGTPRLEHSWAEMNDGLNEGTIGDTAKLMMHRLIVRSLRRDPSLVEKAKVAHGRQAEQFAGWPFVREWHELLALPAGELAQKLISRDREMVRLRNTSPFYLTEGIDFGDYDMRVRLRRAARRIVQRGLSARPTSR